MLQVNNAKLLGFTVQEKKILNILMKKPNGLTATMVSNQTSEPRTTVNFYLKKMLLKGWVRRFTSPDSVYPLWGLVRKDEIQERVMSIFAQFGITATSLKTVTAESGYQHIENAYRKIIESRTIERVYVIQGSQAPFGALKNISTEFIEEQFTTEKAKQIIIEGITSQRGLSAFQTMSRRVQDSHKGRLSVVYVLPDEYLDFDAEVFVVQTHVIIVQPGAGKSLIIDDPTIAQVIKNMLMFMMQFAKKINLNQFLKSVER